MELIKELLGNEFGIMSAIVILFILGMAVFFIWLFIKKSGEKPNK
ncbi:MAG: DUF3149 domain-containing protein [Gammaproteobacteria bacterium]|nr:DUF3149 domain-containing protein [Gammaproteobacteria bacterium]